MPYDYTDAPPSRDIELIPHGTVATVVMHIRAGGAGEDGLLKRSKIGDCEMLDCEFVVAEGQYKGRKFWEYMVLEGTTDGHAEAAKISRGRLRTIIESARGIEPGDVSPQARAARTVGLKDFDNLIFIAKIGVEKGGPIKDRPGENYRDKNILAAVITKSHKDWHPVEQPPPFNGGGTAPGAASADNAPSIARPGWA
jgi:hypothetical protein